MDERFHTPRQSANSSRSQNSSYGTPRANDLHSNRSISSSDSESIYRTPRSTYKSPADMDSGNHPHGRLWGGGGHDRSRDLRRFSDRGSLPHRPVSASIPHSYVPTDRHQDYDLAENGALRKEPNFNVFSFARHGRVGELEELLLRGVPIDTADENGNQILHIGCQNGKKKIVKMALKYGAAVNAQNSVGNTALHFCTKYGFGDTLGRYLISKGADPSLRNKEGRLCTEVV